MPAWALTGGAVGLAALVLFLALRGGFGSATQTADASGAPSGQASSGDATSGASGADQPTSPYITLGDYTGTTGAAGDASAGVAASSPAPTQDAFTYTGPANPYTSTTPVQLGVTTLPGPTGVGTVTVPHIYEGSLPQIQQVTPQPPAFKAV